MYNQKYKFSISSRSFHACEVKTKSFRVNVSSESALQVSQLTTKSSCTIEQEYYTRCRGETINE